MKTSDARHSIEERSTVKSSTEKRSQEKVMEDQWLFQNKNETQEIEKEIINRKKEKKEKPGLESYHHSLVFKYWPDSLCE